MVKPVLVTADLFSFDIGNSKVYFLLFKLCLALFMAIFFSFGALSGAITCKEGKVLRRSIHLGTASVLEWVSWPFGRDRCSFRMRVRRVMLAPLCPSITSLAASLRAGIKRDLDPSPRQGQIDENITDCQCGPFCQVDTTRGNIPATTCLTARQSRQHTAMSTKSVAEICVPILAILQLKDQAVKQQGGQLRGTNVGSRLRRTGGSP